jgi:cytochrome b561
MQQRYSKLNQAFHWITVLCMFALLPLAWVMVNAKRGPNTGDLFAWHETLGATVLIVTAIRIGWRFVDGPPDYPPAVRPWERRLAHAAYWIFFAALIYMPITGLLSANYSGHRVKLFDALPIPLLVTPDKAGDEFFSNLHLWGQWAIYTLIALHLAAVAFHLVFRRDGVLGRMLPAYAAEPASERPPTEDRPRDQRPQPAYRPLREHPAAPGAAR